MITHMYNVQYLPLPLPLPLSLPPSLSLSISLSLSLSLSPSPPSLSLLTVHKLQGNTIMSYYGMKQLPVTGNNHVTFCE